MPTGGEKQKSPELIETEENTIFLSLRLYLTANPPPSSEGGLDAVHNSPTNRNLVRRAVNRFLYFLASTSAVAAGLLRRPRTALRCSIAAIAISTSAWTSSGVKAPTVTISQGRMVV